MERLANTVGAFLGCRSYRKFVQCINQPPYGLHFWFSFRVYSLNLSCVQVTNKAAEICGQGFLPLDELFYRVVESLLHDFEAGVFMCRMPFLTHNPPHSSGLGTGTELTELLTRWSLSNRKKRGRRTLFVISANLRTLKSCITKKMNRESLKKLRKRSKLDLHKTWGKERRRSWRIIATSRFCKLIDI